MPFSYTVTFDEWNTAEEGMPTQNGYYWVGRWQTGRVALVYMSLGMGDELSVPAEAVLQIDKITHWFGPIPAPEPPTE